MKIQECPDCSSSDLTIDKGELVCKKCGIIIESNRFEEKHYHQPQMTNLRSLKEVDKHADVFLARKKEKRVEKA